ncbi:MAG: hypothetical protein EBU67_08870 [Actinobacteria bacterium]|nr:hypothetical protein [Actinomycetota bacterium]NBP54381.1 hypothetical protein [Actinomycetota bacterium]
MTRAKHTRRLRVAGIALLVVALVAGCTKSADKSPESLVKGLLDITDMPGEWQETQRDAFTSRTNENPSIDPSIWCPDASDEAAGLTELAGAAGADVEMQMQLDNAEAPRLMRLQAWRNESVREYFTRVVAVVNICDDAKWTEDPGVTQEMWKIDGPEVGDESVSWGSGLVPPKGKEMAASMGHTTVARIGDVIMVLQIGDYRTTPTSETLSDDEWREIVQRAADKLADA